MLESRLASGEQDDSHRCGREGKGEGGEEAETFFTSFASNFFKGFPYILQRRRRSRSIFSSKFRLCTPNIFQRNGESQFFANFTFRFVSSFFPDTFQWSGGCDNIFHNIFKICPQIESSTWSMRLFFCPHPKQLKVPHNMFFLVWLANILSPNIFSCIWNSVIWLKSQYISPWRFESFNIEKKMLKSRVPLTRCEKSYLLARNLADSYKVSIFLFNTVSR